MLQSTGAETPSGSMAECPLTRGDIAASAKLASVFINFIFNIIINI